MQLSLLNRHSHLVSKMSQKHNYIGLSKHISGMRLPETKCYFENLYLSFATEETGIKDISYYRHEHTAYPTKMISCATIILTLHQSYQVIATHPKIGQT